MDLTTIASIGMQNDLLRLESISQNLANTLTTGYKRQVALGASFALQMQQAAATTIEGRAPLTLLAGSTHAAQAARISLDTSMGVLKYTGNAQDVAIDGDSFFEIHTPQGMAYTRQGSLHVDASGRLVGVHGMPLMGVGGDITLNGGAFTIAANGDIQQGERIAGRLKRVRFDHPEQLTPAGNGLYHAGSALALDASDALRVGFQENSNVSSAQEMVRLTETVRHFEALQKIVQGHDDVLEKAIRKLGEF